MPDVSTDPHLPALPASHSRTVALFVRLEGLQSNVKQIGCKSFSNANKDVLFTSRGLKRSGSHIVTATGWEGRICGLAITFFFSLLTISIHFPN